jgi:hypothetical protein
MREKEVTDDPVERPIVGVLGARGELGNYELCVHVLVPRAHMGTGFLRRETSGVRLSTMIIQQLKLQCFVCLFGLQWYAPCAENRFS